MTAQMTLGQAIEVADKIRHGLPQAVFDNGKAPFGFVHRGWAGGADFIGGPNLFHQTMQATTQFVLFKYQQAGVLAIRQGVHNLVILADQGAARHFSRVRSEYQLDTQLINKLGEGVFALRSRQLNDQCLQFVFRLGFGAGEVFLIGDISQVQKLVKRAHDGQDALVIQAA